MIEFWGNLLISSLSLVDNSETNTNPSRTQRYLDVYKTSKTLGRRRMNVERTLSALEERATHYVGSWEDLEWTVLFLVSCYLKQFYMRQKYFL